MSETTNCWINGKLTIRSEAKVSVYDHGFLYDDGVFEGIRFFNRKPFLLNEHLIRLKKSAQALALKLPYDNQTITDAIEQVINSSANDSGYLRLVVTRGEGALGIDPTSCKKPSLISLADQLDIVSQQIRKQGAQLIIASIRRLPTDIVKLFL
ncbi:MAG: aminotransferase class IV [Candidatus Thiodiazotropha sp.]